MPPIASSTPWSILLNAVFRDRADSVSKLLAAAGFSNASQLLAVHSSFTTGAPDPVGLASLAETLHSAGTVNGVAWPAPSKTDTTAVLQQLVMSASNLVVPSAPAPAAPAAAAGAAVTTGSTVAARHAQVGGEAYATAAVVHTAKYPGSTRIKYEMVGKLQDGFKSRKPVAYALGEYGLELAVKSARTESYTHLGVTFVAQDAYEKPTTINTWELLVQQVQRRSQAKAVAGCFDVAVEARARGLPVPKSEQVHEESKVAYVDSSGAVPRAKEMNCFATVQVMQHELEALTDLHRAQPHVSIDQLIQIDTKVQAKQADYLMEGYTLDAAVIRTCLKSPELYSTAMLRSEAADDSAADGSKSGDAASKGGNKRKADRTEAEELAAMRRQMENKEKQIENLKRGKGGGRGGWQQGGRGGWQQGGWQQGGKGGWSNWTPQPPQQWQGGGKGAGPPNGGGNTAVCQDFNYKVSGCSRPNCKFPHVCSQCGGNHPFRGNH